MREVKWTSKFKKKYKLAVKRGLDVSILKDVVGKLQNDIPLEPKYKDHNLVGELKDFRECHLTSDWLLVYFKSDEKDNGVKKLVLTLVDTGTHSDLFK